MTTRFWRGVFRWDRLGRPVRRACDWRRARNPAEVAWSVNRPSCPDCSAYAEALRRMGVVGPGGGTG